jgi:ABC-type bacteriocin/lantibiotic exporter with double-glycine peptidase domain
MHAVVTAILTACLLAWSIHRWQIGAATPGDVVLVITLGLTVLHGTRDLAVALMEMVQDWARLGEALTALLVPHDMPDHPDKKSLAAPRGEIVFSDVDFSYGEARPILRGIKLSIAAGERVGLVGRSGSGKSPLIALLQRQYDPSNGRILIDGADIAALSRDSLAAAISVVSQDVQLFHRSVMETSATAGPMRPMPRCSMPREPRTGFRRCGILTGSWSWPMAGLSMRARRKHSPPAPARIMICCNTRTSRRRWVPHKSHCLPRPAWARADECLLTR